MRGASPARRGYVTRQPPPPPQPLARSSWSSSGRRTPGGWAGSLRRSAPQRTRWAAAAGTPGLCTAPLELLRSLCSQRRRLLTPAWGWRAAVHRCSGRPAGSALPCPPGEATILVSTHAWRRVQPADLPLGQPQPRRARPAQPAAR